MRLLARVLGLLLLVACFAFGVLFTFQNDTPVSLDLLIVQFSEQWLAVWVLVAFILGGLIGVCIGVFAVLRVKRQVVGVKRQLKSANLELERLRASGAKP